MVRWEELDYNNKYDELTNSHNRMVTWLYANRYLLGGHR